VDLAGELVVSAAARLGRLEPTLALASASRALDLLGDDNALAEECDGAWADGLRRQAAELRRDARHLLAAAATATGQAELARESATTATNADPYDERAHRDLIIALVRDGRQTAALEQYETVFEGLRGVVGRHPRGRRRGRG